MGPMDWAVWRRSCPLFPPRRTPGTDTDDRRHHLGHRTTHGRREALNAGNPVTEIVWMGGAVACGGNMTPAAEFNAWLDPEAADLVLGSGARLSMVLSM